VDLCNLQLQYSQTMEEKADGAALPVNLKSNSRRTLSVAAAARDSNISVPLLIDMRCGTAHKQL
jgi:hypothetical protein